MRCIGALVVAIGISAGFAGPLPTGVEVVRGAINRVRIGDVAVYADTNSSAGPAKYVLFTHARRDAVQAGAADARRGAACIVPAAERELFSDPGAFWQAFEKSRFHDYAQRSTKVPVEPLPVARAVRGGDMLELGGTHFEVLDTPGFTPGAVSYLCERGGKRIAFTGDLILEDGRLADLYSLQDAVPEAKTRGYHGYAARAGALIASLRRVAAKKPDVLVPVRGGVIENPQTAINALIHRLQALMANHFSTDALLWYWGPDNLRVRSAAILDNKPVDSMPMAEQAPLPDWIVAIDNSRLILSRSGAAFLVDAGVPGLPGKLNDLQRAKRLSRLEGIWLTHYHDDHTDHAQEVADQFKAPVYATAGMVDILAHPDRYRMPCLTTAPVRAEGQPDGRTLRWHEFELTFYDFPGQTLYHGGLHIRRDTGESVFFAGDSFTPSGIDDYCLYNRNILREGEGFLYCLGVVKKAASAWLINQHVGPMFRFDGAQYAKMEAALAERMRLLDDLSPWCDRNLMLDEGWARLYPYGQNAAPAAGVDLQIRIMNHCPDTREFQLKWNLPAGITGVHLPERVRIAAHREGIATARLRAVRPGLEMITVDLRSGSLDLPAFAEAMIRVQ